MFFDEEALTYFADLLQQEKIVYRDGELWKMWEPRRNWLSNPVRAEKRTSNGYYMLRTTIKAQGRPLYVMAHRVIWTYFQGPIPEGMVINHINGIKDDNRIENLEIVTNGENIKHAFRTGLRAHRNVCKLTDDDIREIRRLYQTGVLLQREIADRFGVRPNQVSRILSGARHRGVQ